MRNVIFVAPFMAEATLRFADAIAGLADTRLLGICNKQEGISAADAGRFHELFHTQDCFNVESLHWAARELEKRHGPIHRIVAVLEQVQGPVAQVRERLGLPGNTFEVANRFLNKDVMKEEFRKHGLPCAKHRLMTAKEHGWEFVREVGYPIVIKPPEGAGCRSTYLVNNDDEMRRFLDEVSPAPDRHVQAEEFIRGDEFTFDCVVIDGKPVFHSITHYVVPPLDAVRNPWIQWTYCLPRHIDGPEFDAVREVGFRTIEKFGMRSGITHMEWFRRADGSVAIGEIAARPPGAHLIKCNGFAHETDFYRVWARAIIDHAFDGPWERKWSIGTAFMRGLGEGRVRGVTGVDEANAIVGKYVVEARLPEVGTKKNEYYEGDGYAIVRAEETETVMGLLRDIVSRVRVQYS